MVPPPPSGRTWGVQAAARDDLELHRRLCAGDRGAFDELYRRYHDEEWGRVVHGDRPLFDLSAVVRPERVARALDTALARLF